MILSKLCWWCNKIRSQKKDNHQQNIIECAVEGNIVINATYFELGLHFALDVRVPNEPPCTKNWQFETFSMQNIYLRTAVCLNDQVNSIKYTHQKFIQRNTFAFIAELMEWLIDCFCCWGNRTWSEILFSVEWFVSAYQKNTLCTVVAKYSHLTEIWLYVNGKDCRTHNDFPLH